MSDAKLKFTTVHLLALLTAVSVICALAQYNVFAAMLACPITLGPTIAHALSPTRSAIGAGVFASVYWTLFLTLPFNPVIFWPIVGSISFPALSPWLVTIPVFSSLIGGYLGARLAIH